MDPDLAGQSGLRDSAVVVERIRILNERMIEAATESGEVALRELEQDLERLAEDVDVRAGESAPGTQEERGSADGHAPPAGP